MKLFIYFKIQCLKTDDEWILKCQYLHLIGLKKKKIFSILELNLKYNTDMQEISSTQSANE